MTIKGETNVVHLPAGDRRHWEAECIKLAVCGRANLYLLQRRHRMIVGEATVRNIVKT
jgi:hypothetical protein